jgi:hypothetical protein
MYTTLGKIPNNLIKGVLTFLEVESSGGGSGGVIVHFLQFKLRINN